MCLCRLSNSFMRWIVIDVSRTSFHFRSQQKTIIRRRHFFIFFCHLSIESRRIKKIHACIFQKFDVKRIKKVQCDDWFMNLIVERMFLSLFFRRIFIFRDSAMLNTNEKLIVIYSVLSFDSAFWLIQNDTRLLHNCHEQYTIVIRKRDSQSFISRWIFFCLACFSSSSLNAFENDVNQITRLNLETLNRLLCISWNAITIEAFFNRVLFKRKEFIDWNSHSTSSTRFNDWLIWDNMIFAIDQYYWFIYLDFIRTKTRTTIYFKSYDNNDSRLNK